MPWRDRWAPERDASPLPLEWTARKCEQVFAFASNLQKVESGCIYNAVDSLPLSGCQVT